MKILIKKISLTAFLLVAGFVVCFGYIGTTVIYFYDRMYITEVERQERAFKEAAQKQVRGLSKQLNLLSCAAQKDNSESPWVTVTPEMVDECAQELRLKEYLWVALIIIGSTIGLMVFIYSAWGVYRDIRKVWES